jgi:hypothetical protein
VALEFLMEHVVIQEIQEIIQFFQLLVLGLPVQEVLEVEEDFH